MNKDEIFDKLRSCELDKEKVIIISGASLVVQGIIDKTSDIDFACDKEYYHKVNWNTKKGAYGIEIKCKDVYEISYNLYFPNDIVIIDGYKFLSLKKCLYIKKELNRKKDREVIQKLEDILENN